MSFTRVVIEGNHKLIKLIHFFQFSKYYNSCIYSSLVDIPTYLLFTTLHFFKIKINDAYFSYMIVISDVVLHQTTRR